MIKFTTKRDKSGNRYTLRVDTIKNTFHRDYNDSWNYSEYITIGKRDREKLIDQLINNGFMEV